MARAAGLTVAECGSGGGGITIPLSDWIVKAGCTPDQAAEVRRRFAEAPQSAKAAFRSRQRRTAKPCSPGSASRSWL